MALLILMQTRILKPWTNDSDNTKAKYLMRSSTGILPHVPFLCSHSAKHTQTWSVFRIITLCIIIIIHKSFIKKKKRQSRKGKRRGKKASHNGLQMSPAPPPLSLFLSVPIWGQFPDRGSCDGSLPFRCNYFERDWAVKHLKNITEAQWVFMLSVLSLRSLQGDWPLQHILRPVM